jgi:hypothetical protein
MMAREHETTRIDADDMADQPGRVRITEQTSHDRGATGTAPGRASRRMASDPAYWRDEDPEREVPIPEALNFTRDRVRWGPIVAGLSTALTSLLMLSLLGLAIGLTVVNAGDAAAQGNAPGGLGRNSAIWGALSALIAFFLGGWVAGRSAAVFDRGWGALNGALVFLVAVPVILWLASMGLGTVLGSLGSFAGSLNPDPGTVQNAADQARQTAQNTQPIDVARAAETARNTSWGTLLGMVIGLGASALGGMLGTRRELEVHPRTGRVTE